MTTILSQTSWNEPVSTRGTRRYDVVVLNSTWNWPNCTHGEIQKNGNENSHAVATPSGVIACLPAQLTWQEVLQQSALFCSMSQDLHPASKNAIDCRPATNLPEAVLSLVLLQNLPERPCEEALVCIFPELRGMAQQHLAQENRKPENLATGIQSVRITAFGTDLVACYTLVSRAPSFQGCVLHNPLDRGTHTIDRTEPEPQCCRPTSLILARLSVSVWNSISQPMFTT